MKKTVNSCCYEYIKFTLVILFLGGYLLLLLCSKTQGNDMIANKTPTILQNLLASEDPVNFAKTHGIRLNNGMVRVIINVDDNFSLKEFVSKYDLKDYKKDNNLVITYIAIDTIKELCKEPSIIFIRLPFKFNSMNEQ